MEDAQIIELFFARSEDAISELDMKYGKLCHKLADNILASAQDAEECVNDAYLSTWNAIPPQRPESLPAFVGTLVRRCSITRYRANTAMKRNSHYDRTCHQSSLMRTIRIFLQKCCFCRDRGYIKLFIPKNCFLLNSRKIFAILL